MVARVAFEELADEILTRLTQTRESNPIDGSWFDIHGATCVEGLDDAETELLGRIRRVTGPRVTVLASMDLHGNVSQRLACRTDLITCYRTASYDDVTDTKQRARRNLVAIPTSEGGTKSRPLKAWSRIPILLPGEQTSTRIEFAKALYQLVPEIEATPGVLNAAIWEGYACADEPRNHAVVMVTGWDAEVIAQKAQKLAAHFWDAREAFQVVAPTGSLAECIDVALRSDRRPFFMSDSEHNPTAGGAGDVTWTLPRVLARPDFQRSDGPVVIYASIPGSASSQDNRELLLERLSRLLLVQKSTVSTRARASSTGRVHTIRHGDRDAIVECVLQLGSVFVVITKLRKPYHHESDFTQLSLEPRSAEIVIVKIGCLEPELYEMAADWRLALTIGSADQDLARLGHARIYRPTWSFDQGSDERPDLTPGLIPSSHEPFVVWIFEGHIQG